MNLSEEILAKMQAMIDRYFEESKKIKEDYKAKCSARAAYRDSLEEFRGKDVNT